MKNYTFHWEVKHLITQFMQAMDDCVIKRYTENNEVEKEIAVSIKYMPKTRTLHYLVNKQQHISLPVMSVWISGINRDNSRVFNKIDGPVYMDEEVANPLQPVPIDIKINVSILTKYQNDMDQIISNFTAYFDPYIILSWKHPNLDREIRSEVIWDGTLAYKYPTEMSATQPYREMVDTSFTIKGWLFKKAGGNVAPIHYISSRFYGLSDFEELEGLDYE